MDYPKSVANIGLVDGKFVDENTASGVVGSLIPSAWGNAVTDEIIAVIKAAGINPTENANDQLYSSINRIVQSGSGGYGIDTGSTNAYAVDYTPDIGALVDGQVLRFRAKSTNTGSATFNPDGKGAGIIVASDYAQLHGGEIVAGGYVWLQWNAQTALWMIVKSIGGGAEASQDDAEAGESNVRWMSPLRVFQAISKKVVQATESVLGIAKIATQQQTNEGADDKTFVTPKKFYAGISAIVTQATEAATGLARIASQALTNAGADDSTIVTPKKLRFGISMSLTTNGYLALPSWLGGLIFQWGIGTVAGGSTATSIGMSVAFPSAAFAFCPTWQQTTQQTAAVTFMGAFNATRNAYNLFTNQSSGTYSITFFAVGF